LEELYAAPTDIGPGSRTSSTATTAIINNYTVTIQDIIHKTWAKQSHRRDFPKFCLHCRAQNKLIRSCLQPPLILCIPITYNYFLTYHITNVDPTVVFAGTQYTLSCVIYGNMSHFITRFIFNGKAYHGDGMKKIYINNRSYQCTDCVELPDNAIHFPCKIPNISYVINDLLYIRTDNLYSHTSTL